MAESLYESLKRRLFETFYSPSGALPYSAPFNERITHAPGVIVPENNLPPGVAAKYLPNLNQNEILNQTLNFGPQLDIETAWRLKQLAQQKIQNGLILAPKTVSSDVLHHEAAHYIYDQGELKNFISELNTRLPEFTRQMLTNSYSDKLNDPTTLSDEGLGFAMNSPNAQDVEYSRFAASKLKSEDLKQKLLKLIEASKKN